MYSKTMLMCCPNTSIHLKCLHLLLVNLGCLQYLRLCIRLGRACCWWWEKILLQQDSRQFQASCSWRRIYGFLDCCDAWWEWDGKDYIHSNAGWFIETWRCRRGIRGEDAWVQCFIQINVRCIYASPNQLLDTCYIKKKNQLLDTCYIKNPWCIYASPIYVRCDETTTYRTVDGPRSCESFWWRIAKSRPMPLSRKACRYLSDRWTKRISWFWTTYCCCESQTWNVTMCQN